MQTTIDPKIILAVSKAITKTAAESRKDVPPGVYKDIKISLSLEISKMKVGAPFERTPTTEIPFLAVCALLLKRMGVQREEALDILRRTMTEALELGKDATVKILEESGVDQMVTRLKNEVISKLPKVPVQGSVSIDPDDVSMTVHSMSIE